MTERSVGPALEVRHLTKRYGRVMAVDDVSFSVPGGTFLTLLGPSGSGKTTILRLIGGFEVPDSGTIAIGGTDIGGEPPHKRHIGVVFQRYALFPHMTVAENVGFPLKQRGMPRPGRAARVEEMLQTVGLPGYGERFPEQLSGGQQQRVALARALVFKPQVLVMDEPLAALDKHLREHLQQELRRLQRRLGITTLYVTHDQNEALALSDHVAIVNAGRIEQVGTPRALYEAPGTEFVARFMGSSNVLRGEPVPGSVGAVRLADGTVVPAARPSRDSSVTAVMVRPERMRLNAPGGSEPRTEIGGRVLEVVFLGDTLEYRIAAAGQEIIVREQNRGDVRTVHAGESVTISWAVADAVAI